MTILRIPSPPLRDPLEPDTPCSVTVRGGASQNGQVERFLLQRFDELEAQQPPGEQELVHFTESLARAVIEEYSAPGDVVLDPFAGFGTTVAVAEQTGRRGWGVELLAERAEAARARLEHPETVVQGDARRLHDVLTTAGLTDPVTLVLTSPPYMTRNDHPENPLAGYTTKDADYETYLGEVGEVFGQVAGLLRPGGHVVVNVANVVHAGVLTTLAWDVARVVGRHLPLRQECYLAWDSQPPDISGDYCLVFGGPQG